MTSLLVVASTAAARGSVPEPRTVVVPAALRARVPQLELSGLAWSSGLDRFLVVIDDTVDLDAGVRHAPLVLALDRAGRLDAEPVPIDGVDAVDDAEAFAAGKDGTFYLLTSHAPNRHGRLHRARRQLLQLHLDGRRLTVTGRVDLLSGPDDLGRLLVGRGFSEGTPVDLEALAFRDGALYLGLKAPLLPDGSAIILRLDGPADVFAAGRLTPSSLSWWGSVRLAVAAGATKVNQGLADLVFSSDGSLYLCGNAPKNGPADGGGALWRVASPRGGIMVATMARRFAGLKPEGAAAAPDGRVLTIVFDRDRLDPLWTTWPLAR